MPTLIHVLDEAGYRTTDDLACLPGLLAQEKLTVWIDSDTENEGLQALLRDVLRIHPLAIEDILSERLTPKLEDYGDYLYLVMHAVLPDKEQAESVGTVEIDVVIGKNWVFTHHTVPVRSVSALDAELQRNPRTLQRGPAFVAHGVIDRMTDYYLPVVDRYEEEIDEVEKAIVERPDPKILERLFGMKRSLQRLRRLSAYQRDLLQRLSRGESDLIPERARPFFRDVYDHFVRIADLADSYRELVTSALDMYMSVVANRTNDVMKVLALISTIMLPLTFIAGVYGMNFEHMPELKWLYGYPFALGLMLVVSLVMGWWFKRRRWL
jgi:magnesium transporter